MSELTYKTLEIRGKPAKRSDEDKGRRIFRDVPISAETVDRDGDIIRVRGIDSKSYMRQKAPPVLVQHGFANEGLPVARTLRLKRGKLDDGTPTLLADFQFRRQGEERTYADDVYDLWDEGFLSASIGFIPRAGEMTYIDADGEEIKGRDGGSPAGRLFKMVELVEWSAVSVPSNRDAIQGRDMLPQTKAFFDIGAALADWDRSVEIKALDPDVFEAVPEPQPVIGTAEVAKALRETTIEACAECGGAALLYQPAGKLLNHRAETGGRCAGVEARGADGPVLAEVFERVKAGFDADGLAVRESLIDAGSIRLEQAQAEAQIHARLKQIPDSRAFVKALAVSQDAPEQEGAEPSPPEPEADAISPEVESALSGALDEIGGALKDINGKLRGSRDEANEREVDSSD